MTSKAAVNRIIETLKGIYPDGLCSLQYKKDYELLFAVRLSAQCTDERVNKVTPALYARFPTLESFAEADPAVAEFDDKLNSILSNPDAMAQIMQLAQSLSGGTGGNNAANAPPPPPSQPGGSSPGWGQQPQTPPPSGGDPLSALAGGLDPQLLLRFLPLIQELGGARDSNARQLLYALRPYLKPERQEKVERALQLARLFHLGRKFLAGWEG